MFFTSLSHSLSWEHPTRLLVNKHIQRAARQARKVLRREAAAAADGAASFRGSRSLPSTPGWLQGACRGENQPLERDKCPWAAVVKCPEPGLSALWGGKRGARSEWRGQGERLAFLKKIWLYMALSQCKGVFGGTSVTHLVSSR